MQALIPKRSNKKKSSLGTLSIVSKNLKKRKARAILNCVGIILAIALIVATLTISQAMASRIGVEVEKFGPNIVITPKTESISLPYGTIILGSTLISETAISQIYTIPNSANIRVLSPKLFGQAQNGNETVILVGLLPENELLLKPWWNITGSIPSNTTNEILVGYEIYNFLGIVHGDFVLLNNVSFKLVGHLNEMGSIDDYIIFAQLNIAQSFLNLTGKVSVIDVGALCENCPVEEISRQIMEAVANVKATPIKQAIDVRMEAVKQTTNFTLSLALIILVVGCAGVLNTMLASVNERKKEIGILMSLGAESKQIFKLFFSESTILGLISSLLGISIGLIISFILGPLIANAPIEFSNIPILPILYIVPISIGLCIVATILPARRASQIDPVLALRSV